MSTTDDKREDKREDKRPGTPLERITDLEESVRQLDEQCKPKDPVSLRMLALATVLGLLTVLCLLGSLKILTAEVIAGILGAVAGRLTSNIGGTTNEGAGGKST